MKPLVPALLVLGLVLSLTIVPGVFTTDDANYLINVVALRQGRVTVANTERLSPSRELLAFDPGPWTRPVTSTPVASTAPPLYAFIALPFSWFGWRGLVALNTLAYLVAIALVFGYTRRYAADAATPWVAAGALAFGGFVIEYAQGVWPHALSIALCTGGIVAAGRTIEDGRPVRGALAGVLLGLATGVRYQNAVILAVTGGCVAWWAVNRWRASAAYALGAIVPLGASALINHTRLDSWNPISKGDGYLNVPVPALPTAAAGSIFDPLTMFWARLVDFSVRPPLVGPDFTWVTYEPSTGAHLMVGEIVQKAFLQSAPWAILALMVFVLAWRPRFTMPVLRRRQLQLLSLITIAILLTFAVSGVRRHDGLVFNQRYLLELLPLAAIGFAWSLDGLQLPMRPLGAGAIWGVLVVMVILRALPIGGGPDGAPWRATQLAILKLPLLLAVVLGVLWFIARSKIGLRSALAAAAGLCLGWGLTIHLVEDVAASHRLRARKAAETAALAPILPDGSALVAYTGYKDAAFPLLFTRDIVILDVRGDEGADAPTLIRELLAQKRRVFVLQSGFKPEVLRSVLAGWDMHRVASPGVDLMELRAGSD